MKCSFVAKRNNKKRCTKIAPCKQRDDYTATPGSCSAAVNRDSQAETKASSWVDSLSNAD